MPDSSTQLSKFTTIFGSVPNLVKPTAIAFDSKGNLYVSDWEIHCIFKIERNGEVSIFAGIGKSGFSGDGGPAISAHLNWPYGIVIDSKDNVYFADRNNNRIRKVSSDGIISSIAGKQAPAGFSGDGGTATDATLNLPEYLGIDGRDNIYFVDRGNCRIRKIDDSGRISTVAGKGDNKPYKGDGGPATEATFFGILTIAVDGKGNIYICESAEHRVCKVDCNDNTIRTFAGGNGQGASGNGGPATEAKLNRPWGIVADNEGNVYIADTNNYRIQKVDSNGIISTVAARDANTEGGSAVTSPFYGIQLMNFDHDGNLYVVETDSKAIRKITLKKPSFTVDIDNPFSVIAVVSPETFKKSESVPAEGNTSKTESVIATGNIISKYAPYQNKAGGWQLSLVTDPPEQEKGIYLRFSVHSKAGEDGKVNHCETLAPLRDNYIINTKDSKDDTTEQQSSGTAFKKYTHTVVAVKDKGVIRLYLNGKQLIKETYTGTIDVNNAEPLTIGKLLPEPEDKDQQGGVVRKASLWNKALSQTEIINYSNCMMDPKINFPLTVDYQVLYNAPKKAEEDFTIQIKGTLSLSVRSGKVYSESFDKTRKFTPKIPDIVKLKLCRTLYPQMGKDDLKNFTFDYNQDPKEFKVTITATHPADKPGDPPKKATDTFTYDPDVNDGVHIALYNDAINEAAQKLFDQANQGQNEVVYQYDKSIQQVFAEIKIGDFSNCAGFWNFYGDGENNGLDFSANKNDVPADQRIPSKPSKKLQTVLPFYMEEQALTNWCWAATSLSVSKFYDSSQEDTQCNLATRIFQNPLLKILDVTPEKPLSKDQSFSIKPPIGNYTYYLQEPLQELNLSSKPYGDPITLDNIDEMLMKGKPIGIRIKWADASGHFAVLSGHYSEEVKDGNEKEANSKPQHFVVINDPWYGMSFMQWGDSGFAQKYQGTGTWSHSYNSRPVWINTAEEINSNGIANVS